MTFAEAAGIMIGGNSGSTEPTMPDLITYTDTDSYSGVIIEHYNVGGSNAYTKRVNVSFSNKGTVNETVNSLHFYDKNGNSEGSISFSGFYVG